MECDMEARNLGKRNRAAVVVLGDIGRSPRMQYHALSLANQAVMEVDVIAYSGTQPHDSVSNHPKIHFHLMAAPVTKNWPRRLYLVALPVKVLVQLATLVWMVCRIPCPDLMLVQNPPSIPTLMVLRLVCWIRGSALIIDWHNFGYTLLGVSLGARHPLVRIHFWYEKYFGKLGDAHLCVTKAMQQELERNWGIRATVFYDRAPAFFRPATPAEKQELFRKLGSELSIGKAVSGESGCFEEGARQALIVSSTSWTADEDFGMLLEAAIKYDERVTRLQSKGQQQVDSFPNLLIVVTGKGPLRQWYEERMKEVAVQHVAFRTMWLAAEDYPVLLGCADLGVCLHTSSSGLDLPMKVVDMFGCGLPVCAMSYSCIGELVREKENGLLFSSAEELSEQLVDLFRNFPADSNVLTSLREGALKSGCSGGWSEEWRRYVQPVVAEVCATAWRPSSRQCARCGT